KLVVAFLLFFVLLGVSAQTTEVVEDSLEKEYFVIVGDTILRESIDLEEVLILNRLKFKSDQDRRTYLILRRKTRKVYPYAKLASERLIELNSRLDQIKSKRQQ